MMRSFIFKFLDSFAFKRSRLANAASSIFALCTIFTFAVFAAISANAANAQTAAAPHFTGNAIPEPPEQHAPWKAPDAKNLDPHFVKAAELLFDQGLPDPRGCEYREIEIVVGSVWSDQGEIVKTHGWVLPLTNHELQSGKKEAQRFAIAWNGLVYPALAVGGKADVEKDAEEIIRRDNIVTYHAWQTSGQKNDPQEKGRRAEYEKKRAQIHRNGWVLDAEIAVQFGPPGGTHHSQKEIERMFPPNASNISLTRIALLLRIGKLSLAQSMWEAWNHGTTFEKNPKTETTTAIYQRLSTEWLFAQLREAVCAQIRGDDELALLTLRALAPLQKVANDEFATLEKPLPPDRKPFLSGPPFWFLDQVKDLLADQERRAHEPNRKILSLTAIEKISDQFKRIAALIEHLDQIYARQDGQPGGVMFGENPTVRALIREGDPAVEPLLRCLESDPRFTRSVHFWRDFAASRTVMSVSEPAYTALTAILHQTFFDTRSSGDSLTSHGWKTREEVAAMIRVYWKKYGKMPLAERWFATLANDEATPEDWIQAAQDIVQPDNKQIIPSSMFDSTVVKTKFANHEPPQMEGESLRSKKNPSVSELLEKRIRALAGNPSNQAYDDPSTRLNEALARWDGKANLKSLRWFSGVLAKRALTAKYKEVWIAPLSRLCLQRIKFGDPDALKEFAEFFKQFPPDQISNGSFVDDVLALTKPMFENAANRDVQAAVKWAFTNPKSPWLKAFAARKNWQIMGDYLTTPLIAMPPVRAFVLRELADKTTAELYTQQLSQLDGMPQFQLHEPEKQRDEAVARCIKILKQYGNNYSYSPKYGLGWNKGDGTRHQAIMHFAPLGHPATEADVKAGRAIFALPANSHPRVVTLPNPFPLTAIWTAWKAKPTTVGLNGRVVHTYDQVGRIWQAEECTENGVTKRYYGFVRAGVLAKAPAEEIEFGFSFANEPIKGELEFKTKMQKTILVSGRDQFKVGEPITFQFTLQNPHGTDLTLPLALSAKTLEQPPKFVTFDLHRLTVASTGDIINDAWNGKLASKNWKPLMTKPITEKFETKTFTFSPTQTMKVGALRLDQIANLTRGIYVIRFHLNDARFSAADPQADVFEIAGK